MLTFTIPEELRRFAYREQAWFYDAMFKAAAETLIDFAHDEKHLGGTPGFTAVLHTWTRQMQQHPHLHVIIPGIALSADGLRVRRSKAKKYLFPIAALAAAFRHRLDKAILHRDTVEHTRHYSQIDPQVWKKPWIVDARAVGRAVTALRYLARYVHKSALSEPRLKGYDSEGKVRLNCQDSDTGVWSIIHLSPDEFLRAGACTSCQRASCACGTTACTAPPPKRSGSASIKSSAHAQHPNLRRRKHPSPNAPAVART